MVVLDIITSVNHGAPQIYNVMVNSMSKKGSTVVRYVYGWLVRMGWLDVWAGVGFEHFSVLIEENQTIQHKSYIGRFTLSTDQ